jgi:hypothetical protein
MQAQAATVTFLQAPRPIALRVRRRVTTEALLRHLITVHRLITAVRLHRIRRAIVALVVLVIKIRGAY